jgi:hypothetical protein
MPWLITICTMWRRRSRTPRRAEKLDTWHKFPQVSRLLGVILAGRRESAAAANEFRNYLKFSPG